MNKPVILTGLRANNDLHIGNYFGALLPMIDMAKRHAGAYQINLFVPDLHSFTTPIDHNVLYKQTIRNLKVFVAAGLDLNTPDVYMYRQSYIPAHSELTWILDCFTGFGEMSRMTQFKDKSGIQDKLNNYRKLLIGTLEARKNIYCEQSSISTVNQIIEIIKNNANTGEQIADVIEDRISVGLFNYPVLMAADILLYGASYVPVGEDQTQHLEFTRDIALRMNSSFGELFTIPKPVKEQHIFFGKDQGLRIKNLDDPTKKMSKSDETGKGVIFLGDDPTAAVKKIMSATTDSVGSIHFDRTAQPGISNLLQILALLTGTPLEKVVNAWEGKPSYGALKSIVAERVHTFLETFQKQLIHVDESALTAKLESSETTMRDVADATLLRVQRAVGLRPHIAASQEEDIIAYRRELSKLGIANEALEHPAAREISKIVAYLNLTIADSLPTFIMHGDSHFVVAIIRGDTKIDIEKVRTALGMHELRMATPEEFTTFTSVPVGAARVYTPGAETIIDTTVFETDYLVGGSGRFDLSIRYKTIDLKRIPGSKVADISI